MSFGEFRLAARIGQFVGWCVGRIDRFRSADTASKAFFFLLVSWIAGISLLSILRYDTFRTNAFDLGIFNQAFHSALEGKLFYETPDLRVIPSGSFLGVHFNLMMFILLPPYALLPRPETLLGLQTVFIGLGAFPVWLISDRVLHNRQISLFLSVAYLLNPAILSLSLYDFHLEAFLPFFLGMLFYSFLTKRWRRYFLFFGLAVITFDFAAVLVGAMSLAHLFRRLRFKGSHKGGTEVRLLSGLERTELIVLLISVCLTPVLMFATLTASSYFSGTSASAVSITSGFFNLGGYSDPRIELRLQFWLILFGVLLFLPVLAPRNLVMVLPWFALTSLPGRIPWFLIGYQYGGAFAAPFLLWGTIFGLRRVSAILAVKRLLPIVLILSIFLSPINPLMQGNLGGIAFEDGFPIPSAHDRILQRAVALIPRGASVLAQNNLFPQVSDRSNAYVYLVSNQTIVDFVFADTSSRWFTATIWSDQSMSMWLSYFIFTGRYGVLVDNDGVVLLQRGSSGSPIPISQQKNELAEGALILNPNPLVGQLQTRSASRLFHDSNFHDGTPSSSGANLESVHEFSIKSTAKGRDYQGVRVARILSYVDPILFPCPGSR